MDKYCNSITKTYNFNVHTKTFHKNSINNIIACKWHLLHNNTYVTYAPYCSGRTNDNYYLQCNNNYYHHHIHLIGKNEIIFTYYDTNFKTMNNKKHSKKLQIMLDDIKNRSVDELDHALDKFVRYLYFCHFGDYDNNNIHRKIRKKIRKYKKDSMKKIKHKNENNRINFYCKNY